MRHQTGTFDYGIFFNELAINEKIASSQFAFNFPNLLVSGYWNGLLDHPMHIFEYLGREVPEEKWDNRKIHIIIKSRLEELHSFGISHYDVRPANIHVSVSGKISLIDFGLSDCTNNEEHKKNGDLDSILGVYGSNENDPQGYHYSQESEVLPDEGDNNENDGSGSNSFSEAVFDEMSAPSPATSTITEGNTPKTPQR